MNTVQIHVTVIDANHCPGACMFIFEGYFGVFFHTGDFRCSKTILLDSRIHRVFGKIDRLYLDDTFLLEPTNDFPTREIVGNEIVQLATAYSQKHGRKSTFIVAVDSLGKEELLIALAVSLKSLVVVSEERMRTISVLKEHTEMTDVFTSNPRLGRIIALSKSKVKRQTVLKFRKKRPHTIGIVPTGLFSSRFYEQKKRNGGKVPLDKLVYRLPYTNHSSYRELETFVKTLRPKCLLSASRKDTTYLQREFGKFCSDDTPLVFNMPRMLQLEMRRSDLGSDNPLEIAQIPCLKAAGYYDNPSRKRKKIRKGGVLIQSPQNKPVVVDLTNREYNRPEHEHEIIEVDFDIDVVEISSCEEAGGKAKKKKKKKKNGEGEFTADLHPNTLSTSTGMKRKRGSEEQSNVMKMSKKQKVE